MKRLAVAGALALALACTAKIDGPDPLTDGGSLPDGGSDAGVDAGTDAGVDAGPGWDAGWPDAGGCPARFNGPGETIASGFSYPRHFALAPDRLFVSEVGVFNKPLGKVDTVYFDGGVEDLISGRSSPDAIVTDGTSVYWVDEGGLLKLGFDGGTPTVLDTKLNGAIEGNTALVLNGSQLVYATGGRFLDVVNTNGTNKKTLFTGDAGTVVTSAAVSGTTVYFLVQGNTPGLYQASLNGNPNPQRLLTEPVAGRALTLDAANFYWATGGNGTGAVQSHPRAGGTTSDLASGLNGPGAALQIGPETYFQDSTAGSPASPWFFQVVTTCVAGPIPVGPVGQAVGDLVLSPDGGTLYFSSNGGTGTGFIGALP